MKELNLHEEIIKSLKLISYDRSLTIREQTLPSDRLGVGGDFDPNIIDINDKFESDKKNKENWKKTLSTWEQRLCKRAKEVCEPYGGIEVFTYENGLFACGCKNGNQQRVLTSNGTNITVNEYFNLGNGYNETTYQIAKFLRDPHNIMMIASIAFTMFSAGILGAVVGGLFDVLDAGLYITEGDYLSAGITLIFLVLPIGKITKLIGFKYTKTWVTKLLKKIKEGIGLTPEENKFIQLITSKAVILETYKQAFKNMIINFFNNKPTLSAVVKFIYKFFQYGFLGTKFLLKNGIVIFGAFYSWYKLCQIFNLLSDDEKNKSTSDTISDLNLIIMESFSALINKNEVLNVSSASKFMTEVLLLQYVLFSDAKMKLDIPTFDIRGGFIHVNNYGKKIKKISVFTTTGKLLQTFSNSSKSNVFVLNKRLSKGVNILIVEYYDRENRKIQVIHTPNKTQFGLLLDKLEETITKPKWGYYDETTKKLVERFQKKYGLFVDGVAGKNTLQRALENVNNKKYGEIKNYLGKPLTDLFKEKVQNELTPEEIEKMKMIKLESDSLKIANDIRNNFIYFDTVSNYEYALKDVGKDDDLNKYFTYKDTIK